MTLVGQKDYKMHTTGGASKLGHFHISDEFDYRFHRSKFKISNFLFFFFIFNLTDSRLLGCPLAEVFTTGVSQ